MARFGRYKRYKKTSPSLSPIERLENKIQAQKNKMPMKSQFSKFKFNLEIDIKDIKNWLEKNQKLYNQKQSKLRETLSEISNIGFISGLLRSDDIKKLREQEKKLNKDISIYNQKKHNLYWAEKKLNDAIKDKNELERLENELRILKEKRDISNRNKEIKEEERRRREIRKKEQEELLKAKAAAHDKKTRVRTEVLKPKVLKEQLKISNHCPYCDIQFEKGKAECDHIMPVSKGGLDRIQNLVYICETCNRKKSTMTVYQFCKWANFDFNVVVSKLEKLGKDV